MSKIIKVIKLSTPEDIRMSMRNIISQLEAYNYAISSDMKTVRLFSRYIPSIYKGERIVISKSVNSRGESVITIKPDFVIEKCGEYSFRIKKK